MKADDLQRLVDSIEILKANGEITAAQAAQLALAAGILGELDRIAETAAKLVGLLETGARHTNMSKSKPSPAVVDMLVQEEQRSLAHTLGRLAEGHDPLVFQTLVPVSPELVHFELGIDVPTLVSKTTIVARWRREAIGEPWQLVRRRVRVHVGDHDPGYYLDGQLDLKLTAGPAKPATNEQAK